MWIPKFKRTACSCVLSCVYRSSTCTAAHEFRVWTPVKGCFYLAKNISTWSTASPWLWPERLGTSRHYPKSKIFFFLIELSGVQSFGSFYLFFSLCFPIKDILDAVKLNLIQIIPTGPQSSFVCTNSSNLSFYIKNTFLCLYVTNQFLTLLESQNTKFTTKLIKFVSFSSCNS